MAASYVGRFAPTPSGPLHLGSLLTATASWLDARSHGGRWRLRIDDLDRPRTVAGAEAAILATLEAHGLVWDGVIVRQSDHLRHYHAALEQLREQCFACRCTRRELRGVTRYPGTCRSLGLPKCGNALRMRVHRAASRQTFEDRVQGQYAQLVADYVVRRRDGLASYPLAVVVDDALLAITHIVRGADLLANTPQQLHVAACLRCTKPSYAHVPVVADAAGLKLSKHNAATAIDDRTARYNIRTVLALLGVDPPLGDIGEMLAWAAQHWQIESLPRTPVLPGFAAVS